MFWATLGAAIAVWEVSGAMRATMQVLNRVYLVEETRTFRQKLLQSITLSTVVTLLLLLAAAAVKLGPIAAHGVFGNGALVSVLAFLAALGRGDRDPVRRGHARRALRAGHAPAGAMGDLRRAGRDRRAGS